MAPGEGGGNILPSHWASVGYCEDYVSELLCKRHLEQSWHIINAIQRPAIIVIIISPEP